MEKSIGMVISAVVGGAGVQIFKWLRNRRKINFNEGLSLRHELRSEIERVNKEVTDLRKDNTEWRSKYWDLVKVNTTQNLKIEKLEILVKELKDEISELIKQKPNQ